MKKIMEMKKLIEKEFFTRRALCGLIVQMCLILTIPLLYIGKYNHTIGDCYWYAFRVHCAWLNTHSFIEVFKAAMETIAYYYETWQGTFTSVLFFSISPVAFGEQYAFIVPYMMIGMICISTFFLFYVLLRKLLKFDGYSYAAIASIASMMQFEFMYTPASGLYWYNGAVHYVFMQGFVNITVAMSVLLLLSIVQNKRKSPVIYLVLTCISGFMASGANFSTTLLNVEIVTLMELVAIVLWRKKKSTKYLLYTIPFLVSAAGFLVNIGAPGNAVRQANFNKGTLIDTIQSCFTYSASQAVSWITIFVMILLLVLLPFILKSVSRINFTFPCPMAVVLICYCLYASMFAPGFYAFGGEEPLSRNQNICKMFLLISMILCELYVVGWLEKRFRIVKKIVPTHNKNIWSWTIVIFGLAIAFVVSFLQLDFIAKKATFVSYGAYDVIQTGHGQQYMDEYLIRLNEYKFNPDEIIYVQPYSVRPYPLWVGLRTETTDDKSTGLLSDTMAKWYGKEAIIEVIESEDN